MTRFLTLALIVTACLYVREHARARAARQAARDATEERNAALDALNEAHGVLAHQRMELTSWRSWWAKNGPHYTAWADARANRTAAEIARRASKTHRLEDLIWLTGLKEGEE